MVKMKPFKVSFVHPDLGIGGAERLILDVAVALADQGVEVEFVTNHFNKEYAFEELKDDRFSVTVIGDWIPRSFCGVFRAFFAYIKMLYLALVYCFFISNKPDIFFVDQIPMAVPVLRLTKSKIIYYCHHPDLLASPPGGLLKKLYRKPINWIEQFGTNKSDKILVNSEYTAEVFKKTFKNVQHRLTILYPSISAAFLQDIDKAKVKLIEDLVPEITSLGNDKIVFLSINRFHPAKQLTLAIDAMDELRKQLSMDDFNRYYLILAGGYDPVNDINKNYYQLLLDIACVKDLLKNIIFLKSPSDKLKAELLKSCDCLIYTPVNEHFGIVPLEAMAASKPVIACNSGGPKETVENNVTGFLCDPNGPSMAEVMVKMTSKQTSKKMGQMGYERMHKLFSNKAFSKQCMDVINETFKL